MLGILGLESTAGEALEALQLLVDFSVGNGKYGLSDAILLVHPNHQMPTASVGKR